MGSLQSIMITMNCGHLFVYKGMRNDLINPYHTSSCEFCNPAGGYYGCGSATAETIRKWNLELA